MVIPKDIFKRLKYIGYCWSQMPPEETGIDLTDFAQYCKFQLCKINHKLMRDPVWEAYGEEEIITEYYAHVFANSKEKVKEFESSLELNKDTQIYDWFDEMIKKNQTELNTKAVEDKPGFEFIPDSLEG